MAPELMRLLGRSEMETQFSSASDVYSFGTVCYELFCYEYPFQSYSAHEIVFLIGSGRKNLAPNIQIAKELKVNFSPIN